MVDEVDDQSLDVRAVLVLVCHDHQLAVAKGAQFSRVSVLLVVLQSQDLHHVGDFCIAHDLCVCVCVLAASQLGVARFYNCTDEAQIGRNSCLRFALAGSPLNPSCELWHWV